MVGWGVGRGRSSGDWGGRGWWVGWLGLVGWGDEGRLGWGLGFTCRVGVGGVGLVLEWKITLLVLTWHKSYSK